MIFISSVYCQNSEICCEKNSNGITHRDQNKYTQTSKSSLLLLPAPAETPAFYKVFFYLEFSLGPRDCSQHHLTVFSYCLVGCHHFPEDWCYLTGLVHMAEILQLFALTCMPWFLSASLSRQRDCVCNDEQRAFLGIVKRPSYFK